MKLVSMILGALLVSFLIAWPAMWIWNTQLVPAVNTLQPVEWLQMWFILILLKFIATPTRGYKND